MRRTRLGNVYLKKRTEATEAAYSYQRNICVSLFKKSKRSYFENLNVKLVRDNKKFWKNVGSLFPNKIKYKERITLIENENIISNDKKVADIFHKFFSNLVKTLNISQNPYLVSGTSQIDPVLQSIEKFSKHPSIINIKKRMNNSNYTFSFKFESQEKFSKLIQNLNCNKATQQYDIPIKILKENSEIFSYILCHNFNNSLFSKVLPNSLKKADIIPVFKKDEKFLKNNYRPVSILPSFSKIYERCMYDQINDYFHQLFSKLQCGFRKGFNARHCLLVLVKKCRKVLDKQGYAGILLTDLSKVFDGINHELLIAKLHAYGFSLESLTFIQSYLSN